MPAGTLIDYVENSIKTHWDLPALSDHGGETLKFRQVAELILLLHELFRRADVSKGDKIALLGRNSANWTTIYLAVVTHGAVVVPILPDFHPDDICHIVNHSDASLLFSSRSSYEAIAENKMPAVKAVLSIDDFSLLRVSDPNLAETLEDLAGRHYSADGPSTSPSEFSLESPRAEDLGAILYTSGSTGFSKGVMLSHRSLTSNLVFARDHMALQPGETILSFLPLAHTYGCMIDFLFPFTMGCQIYFLGDIPSPKRLMRAFQEVRPSLINAVPLILEKIYKREILPMIGKRSMRWMMRVPGIKNVIRAKIREKLLKAFGGNAREMIVGGAALNTEAESFLRMIGFPLTVGYGMTECGPLISYAPWRETRATSVGRVVDRMEIRINSKDPHSIVEEILVRGDNVMEGYYKNEATTSEALDENGWLHTGDLGLVDDDGFVYIRGRCKSMILGPSGHNIYPEEIESRINNLPLVKESLVVDRDGKLCALVRPDLEEADAERMDEQEIEWRMELYRKALNRGMPAASAISRIELYPQEFEKTPTGKIKRFLYEIPP